MRFLSEDNDDATPAAYDAFVRLASNVLFLFIAAVPGCATHSAAPGVWAPCKIATIVATTQASCATYDMPRGAGREQQRPLSVAVTRLSAREPVTGQLWMLQGGPGGSGQSLIDAASQLQALLPGFEIYLLDHRGTGGSTYLGCPELIENGSFKSMADLPACAREATRREGDLGAFGTRQAADDLGRLIERLRRPQVRTLVWGGSYGAYWASRYLQAFPLQADGVVLDSGCLGNTCRLADTDRWLEDDAHTFLNACAANVTCSAHFSGDPWTIAQGLARRFEGGWCAPATLDRGRVRALLSGVALEAPTLLAPLLRRLDRCDANDIAALRFAKTALAGGGNGDPGFSPVLQDTIVLSELWNLAAPADLAAEDTTATFTTGQAIRWTAEWSTWPRYTPDTEAGRWNAPRIPVLAIRGGRDLRLPRDVSAAGASRLGVSEVVVEEASHGVLLHSACGTSIIVSFLRDPKARLDTACASVSGDIAPDSNQSRLLFGTEDAWGDEAR